MKFSIVASIIAFASVSIAAPSSGAALTKRGPCPEAGSGNIDPCCFDGGPDENCRSVSNCYTRCGPSGPNDQGGVLGCIAGCATVCPETAEC